MKQSLLIKGGRVIDPSTGLDAEGDVLLTGGIVSAAGGSITSVPAGTGTIHADGMVVCPGFIDLHCHLREPGFEEKETIASGTRAAARGGYTTVCCMPNTNPPVDSGAVVDSLRRKCELQGVVRVLPVGCITRGRKGLELSDMAELVRAGVVGFSDDGNPVANSRLMRYALEYSLAFGIPVMDHCEDLALSEGGMMNEGSVSARLGLRGISAVAEENMVGRDLSLALSLGARVHICHVSTAGSVDLVRLAKRKGARVTAEAAPHHLALTEERVMGAQWAERSSNGSRGVALGLDAYDTNAKVNPPLRTEEDRRALLQGLSDGTIDAIATDHAPHTWVDKTCEFGYAAFGISGLETSLGVLMGLVHGGELDLATMVSLLTSGPAGVLGRCFSNLGTLAEGSSGDVTIFDPNAEWVVDPEKFASRGRNTPFKDRTLRGKVMATIVAGKPAYLDERLGAEVPGE